MKRKKLVFISLIFLIFITFKSSIFAQRSYCWDAYERCLSQCATWSSAFTLTFAPLNKFIPWVMGGWFTGCVAGCTIAYMNCLD
jgi:hypothetical protein